MGQFGLGQNSANRIIFLGDPNRRADYRRALRRRLVQIQHMQFVNAFDDMLMTTISESSLAMYLVAAACYLIFSVYVIA